MEMKILSNNSNKCLGRMAQCTTDQLTAFAVGGRGHTAGIDHNCIRAVINPDNCISVAGELFSDGSSFCIVELAAESM